MKTAVAYLDDIRPRYYAQHELDQGRVESIMAAVRAAGTWTLPPVLVVEDAGDGCIPLDGHHRLEAAKRLGLATIPAHVISMADYCALLDEHWGGYAPARLADLDDHILVDGAPYSGRGVCRVCGVTCHE